MRTDTQTLVKALRVLVNDIYSEDGVANACIAEAADRIEELERDQTDIAFIAYQQGYEAGKVDCPNA